MQLAFLRILRLAPFCPPGPAVPGFHLPPLRGWVYTAVWVRRFGLASPDPGLAKGVRGYVRMAVDRTALSGVGRPRLHYPIKKARGFGPFLVRNRLVA
jgi:hypothetical protein